MFDALPLAPPDAILGLADAFKHDSNPRKINLSVGVYKDEQGNTPILACVKEAERRLLANEKSKGYLSIEGHADYAARVQELLFGAGHEVIAARRAVTAQTPGGTGSLRVAADILKKHFPRAKVWLSKPTWANHAAIFMAAGQQVESYAYVDGVGGGLDLAAMLQALRQIPAGDVILLHACCHNPTGIDPLPDQWRQIAVVVHERGILPLVDFAYQGFGEGLEQDAAGLRELLQRNRELLVCSSFSKNFGLYCERVGALTFVAKDKAGADIVQSQVKVCIRSNYSNPPAHGAELVTAVLGDAELRKDWEKEVADMRGRINGMRELLVKTLKAKGVPGDYSFITRQRGMFSFSGLTPEQVEALKQKYSIYIVGSGRINVAGITEQNVEPLCDAIAEVVNN